MLQEHSSIVLLRACDAILQDFYYFSKPCVGFSTAHLGLLLRLFGPIHHHLVITHKAKHPSLSLPAGVTPQFIIIFCNASDTDQHNFNLTPHPAQAKFQTCSINKRHTMSICRRRQVLGTYQRLYCFKDLHYSSIPLTFKKKASVALWPLQELGRDKQL